MTTPLDLDVRPGAVSSPAARRVAVICDFLEEGWPSMDLNAEMLYGYLAKNHASEFAPIQFRPPFRRRLSRIPLVRESVGRNADRMLNRFVDYPKWLRGQRGEFDLFHLVDHSYSQLVHYLPADRTIVTCHDLDTFRCVLEPREERRPLWFQAMTRRILQGFQRASRVICNSDATRGQLLRHGLFPAEKITVIHSGVHPMYTPLADASADAEAARLLQGPTESLRLLSVGSTIPRKRMDVLLRVFASVLRDFPRARLIRVGGPFTASQLELAKTLQVDQAISVLPFVSREVLASIYRKATLLLQTSDAEGFGMPLAEAMACGCPVAASDLQVLREIGGAACEYCPVGDVTAWKTTIRRLLQEDGREAARRRELALAQAGRYSWAENARRTVEVYREVCQAA